MQVAALVHVCRYPFAYPVDENHLRVVLKAAKGDLAAATVVYGDRYAWPVEKDQPLTMDYLGEDGVHEYWGATLPTATHRVRYLIHVEDADNNYLWLTEQGPVPRRPTKNFFQFAYIHRADLFKQPAWIEGATFYQIFPDRFYNGNPKNDPKKNKMKWGAIPTRETMAGGDLAGIEQKLDYVQDLGIGCVYTTPIFKSPTNHKYDTTDYYKIDPSFGTNEEFKSLVGAVHERGMRFMLDAVFNHSGKEWFPFKDVIQKGADSKYVDWFYNIHSFPVDTDAITYETFANNVASMPKLNTANPELQQYLLKVARHWITDADIDGWRLDVANEVNHGFWRAFREAVKGAKADAWILGEIWHEATEWLQGDQYDSVMNYPWREATLSFLKGQIDAVEYDRVLTRLRFTHSHEVMKGLLSLLGTHDTARVKNELGESREKAAQAAVLLLTAEGVPLVYYGDEVGMTGANDPDCRRCYPWHAPESIDQDMLHLYKRLIHLRRTYRWMNDGAWETFEASSITGVYGFRRLPTPIVAPERPLDEEGIYVVINNSYAPATVELPADTDLADLVQSEISPVTVNGNRVELPAHGFAVLAPKALASLLQ
jgi:cyclomaltodextrinase / maltogenic alpha-amylase / neopullulanase